MATVSCRALCIVRWYEVSRVLGVSSALTAGKSFRNETPCRRWSHISQRSLSTTTGFYAPRISLILAKNMGDPKHTPKETGESTMSKNKTTEKSLLSPNTDVAAAGVTVSYHRGLPRIAVPLPSRREKCVFILKPITDTVGDFIRMLKREDRGIDRAIVSSLDGVRIGSKNTIESLLEEDFQLTINDNTYNVQPPLLQRYTVDQVQKLSDVQMLVGQLYEAFQVREYYADMEKQVMSELEAVTLELEPLEQKLQELEITARSRSRFFMLLCIFLMSTQYSGLARLTWWEYSWDIVEPITYFITFTSILAGLIYYGVTQQEFIMSDILNRRSLLTLYRKCRKTGFDLAYYNSLKDRRYELETTLKIIRGPLYEYRSRIEQRARYRSSSSSSRSPSSSPSPSPSPERTLRKKETAAQ